MPCSRKFLIYWPVIIVVLILAVYGNTLHHGFVWDDTDIIVDHPLLGDLHNIPKLFLSEDIADVPTGYYRPVTYLSFALERAVWGVNPIGYNITNLLLYILVALLFNRLVLATFKSESLALIAAMFFALHPIAGETVNFHAGGRNTLLCACFTLLAMLFHTRNRAIPAAIFFTLAIFSKEFALLTPLLLILSDRYVTYDKKPWYRYLPYAVAITCYLGLRSYVVATRANLLESIHIADTIWILPQIFGSYLANMILPFRVKTMYDVVTVITWTSFISWSLLLLSVIVAAIVFRKRREIPAAIVIFFLFLIPVSNIIPLGITMMADRYAFFSLFGFCLGLAYLVRLTGNRAAIAITIAVCTFYTTIDIPRNHYWENEISFFSQMTKDAPGMSVGFQNLGYAYYDVQDYPNADKYLSLALSKKELNSRMLTGSASMFWDMKLLDKALLALKRKMAMEPGNPEAYIMASKIYFEMGDEVRAREYRDKSTKLFPGIFEMMAQRTETACRLGEEKLAKQKPKEAERFFKEALTIDPSFVPALLDMGGVLA
jgi:tetratricopeptide (TPR) repeat protein